MRSRRRAMLWAVCGATLAGLAGTGSAAPPPTQAWARFISGDLVWDNGDATMAADAAGNVYVAGQWATPATTSDGKFAVPSTDSRPAGHDLFVAKLNPAGGVVWLRSVGGSEPQDEFVLDIAVLSDGRIALAVETSSPDFPGTPLGTYHPGSQGQLRSTDAVVAVLDSGDGHVAWARYLGGAEGDSAWSVAAAPGGGVVVGGRIHPAGVDDQTGFVALFDHAGNQKWLRSIAPTKRATAAERAQGVTDEVMVRAVTVDRTGRILAAGWTRSPHLPGRWLSARGAGLRGFVTALDLRGRTTWLSQIGGRGDVAPRDIAAGADGTVTVVGYTEAADFPRVNGWQPLCRVGDGVDSGFVTVLAADGKRLLKSSCLGGSQGGMFFRVEVGRDGSTYIGGLTLSGDFPTVRPFQRYFGGGSDAVLVVLDRTRRIRTATFLGGLTDESGTGLTVVPGGGVVLAGTTFSNNFPGAGSPTKPSAVDEPVGPSGIVHAATYVTRLNGT